MIINHKKTPPGIVPTALAALLCAAMRIAAAQTPDSSASDFRFSGFGTLGLTHTVGPTGWGFKRTIDAPANAGGTHADTDSRLGLQGNYTPADQFEVVGQLLLNRRSPATKDSEAIAWAFVAYRPNSNWTLRVGRLNLDVFLMSDYRNVGFAYLYARPPVEFYGSIPASLDGADVARVWNTVDAQYRLKALIGRVNFQGIEITPGYGVSASREGDGLILRAALSRVKFVSVDASTQLLLDGLGRLSAIPVPSIAEQAAAMRRRLDYSGDKLTYLTLGASYEKEQWQWSAEFMHTRGGPNTRTSAGYASVGRRVGPTTIYSIASAAKGFSPSSSTPEWGATLAPILGPTLAQQVQRLGAGASFAENLSMTQRTASLGVRWDLQPRVALKFQFDRVWVGVSGSGLWANGTAAGGAAGVSSVLLDFVF